MFDSRDSNRFSHHQFTSTNIFTDHTKSSSCHNYTIVKPSDQGVISLNIYGNIFQAKQFVSWHQIFWIASLVPYKKDYRFDRVPKMAFMFFTRGSLPMLLLWERFYRGNDKLYSIYVHAHPKYRIKASKDSPFHVRQI
jgi:hypothetical protein